MNTKIKNNQIVKVLKFILTLPDVIMFAYYSAIPKAIKQVNILKRFSRKGKKKSSVADLNFNKVAKLVHKELKNHLKTNPFLLAFMPTIILILLIWI